MHWKAKHAQLPKHGDLMTITRRAWMPKKIGDVWIWLEQYSSLYVYEIRTVATSPTEGVMLTQWQIIKQLPVRWKEA